MISESERRVNEEEKRLDNIPSPPPPTLGLRFLGIEGMREPWKAYFLRSL